MKQNSKQALTPKLRFPEFRDEPGWTKKRLGDAATLINERAGNKECTPFTVSSGAGLVSQQERFGRTIAGNQLKNYFLLRKNDFAYNKSATKSFPEGFIARYLGDPPAAVPNSIFTCFRLDEHAIDPGYLDHLFSSNLHGKWLKRFIMVGARAHGSLNVSDADLLSLPVPLPSGTTSLVEQQKIADCLSSLDEVITARARKVEALKAHKHALMQQLFPRESEATPRMRFPKFRNTSEWEERPIASLGRVVTGSTPSTARPDFYGGGRLFVSPADISDLRFVKETKTTLSDLGFMQTRPIQANSVLFVCIGSTIGKIAQVSEECATNQQINAIVPKPEISADFVYYLLSHNAPRIAELAGTQAVPIINKALFSSVTVRCPERKEQEHIAGILGSLDELIAAQVRTLHELRTHKAGLMQKLFPLPAESEA